MHGSGHGHDPRRHVPWCGPPHGLCQRCYAGRRVPFDEHELSGDAVSGRLLHQTVEEPLHSGEQVPTMVVVPRRGDDTQLGAIRTHSCGPDVLATASTSSTRSCGMATTFSPIAGPTV